MCQEPSLEVTVEPCSRSGARQLRPAAAPGPALRTAVEILQRGCAACEVTARASPALRPPLGITRESGSLQESLPLSVMTQPPVPRLALPSGTPLPRRPPPA